MSRIEYVRAGGRLFRLTMTREDLGLLVDVRDVRSTFETQAILRDGEDCEPVPIKTVLTEPEVYDAIRSVYASATSHESGQFPSGGIHLPEDFPIYRSEMTEYRMRSRDDDSTEGTEDD